MVPMQVKGGGGGGEAGGGGGGGGGTATCICRPKGGHISQDTLTGQTVYHS